MDQYSQADDRSISLITTKKHNLKEWQGQNNQWSIAFNEQKLYDNKRKSEYLIALLKQTNPAFRNKPKFDTNDLLVNQMQAFINTQQAQNICNVQSLKEIQSQFSGINQQLENQKELSTKYENKILKYIEKIHKQANSSLNTLKKSRIQKQIQLAQKIDTKLINLSQALKSTTTSENESEITCSKQECTLPRFAEVKQRLHSIKKLHHLLQINQEDNQTHLTNLINSKLLELNHSFASLKASSMKLDQLLEQICGFQKSLKQKLSKLNQQRTLKEQSFMKMIEKILSFLQKTP